MWSNDDFENIFQKTEFFQIFVNFWRNFKFGLKTAFKVSFLKLDETFTPLL